MLTKFTSSVARNVSKSIKKSAFSTVQAQTIHVTFVDQEGNQARFPARIGQTLLDVAKLYKVDVEGPCNGGGAPSEAVRTAEWTEYVYGEGPTCFGCHVQIPSKYHHLLPPQTSIETEGLEENWDEEFVSTSRLACQIKLEKKHDGMVILVPDAFPMDII